MLIVAFATFVLTTVTVLFLAFVFVLWVIGVVVLFQSILMMLSPRLFNVGDNIWLLEDSEEVSAVVDKVETEV